MDRFIELMYIATYYWHEDLKSNMDRFIEFKKLISCYGVII